tara:strand:- start:365 stop:499 length:135 start_codon:yes stop_codon:yes gene_type:complete
MKKLSHFFPPSNKRKQENKDGNPSKKNKVEQKTQPNLSNGQFRN